MLHWHFSSGKVVLLSLLKEAKPSPDRQKMIKLLLITVFPPLPYFRKNDAGKRVSTT